MLTPKQQQERLQEILEANRRLDERRRGEFVERGNLPLKINDDYALLWNHMAGEDQEYFDDMKKIVDKYSKLWKKQRDAEEARFVKENGENG